MKTSRNGAKRGLLAVMTLGKLAGTFDPAQAWDDDGQDDGPAYAGAGCDGGLRWDDWPIYTPAHAPSYRDIRTTSRGTPLGSQAHYDVYRVSLQGPWYWRH
jgi:hypothetical protein